MVPHQWEKILLRSNQPSFHFHTPPHRSSKTGEYRVTKRSLSINPRAIALPDKPAVRTAADMTAAAAGRRRLRMATVALLAVAAAAFAATPTEAAKKERSFVRKTVKDHDIVIFSKSYCPYCKRAKGVFKDLNKDPFVVELDQREDGPAIQEALSEIVGRRTVPQVFINGKHLGGSDDTVEAYESGKLKELLNISSKEDL